MGNYQDLEYEFIERTIALINQYYASLDQYPFEKQYNYTLTINCLLGLIVMPKERALTYLPKLPINNNLKASIGLNETEFGGHISNLKTLIQSLRHSIAHFNIDVISEGDEQLIDWVEFTDSEHGHRLVARFRAKELLPFLKFYTESLLNNLKQYRNSKHQPRD
ncbi:HEPN family nuclease [Methylophilus sp. 3sh_L]|uniref:HEPN family nuclease n=1 Tax=Methylophilus sp. 3sh_L TaxID=3377114 RepID=UPI00398F60AC